MEQNQVYHSSLNGYIKVSISSIRATKICKTCNRFHDKSIKHKSGREIMEEFRKDLENGTAFKDWMCMFCGQQLQVEPMINMSFCMNKECSHYSFKGQS